MCCINYIYLVLGRDLGIQCQQLLREITLSKQMKI